MSTTMTFAERLNKALEYSNKKRIDLAAACGVSRAAVTQWTNGSVDGFSKTSYASAAAKFLGVSLQWLAEGKGEMLDNTNIHTFEDGDMPPDDVVVIHEYKLTFGANPAGVEAEPEWELVEGGDDYWYKRSFFQKRHLNPDKCKRAKVTGDSMEPFIYSGDTVLFSEVCDPRPACIIIQDGKIYVISVDGKLKIKRLASIKDGIAVRSDNPAYTTEEYTGADLERLRIYGRVVEISRSI